MSRCLPRYLDGVDGYVEQGWAEHGLVVGVEGGDEAAEDGEAGQAGHEAGVGGGLVLDNFDINVMYINIHNIWRKGLRYYNYKHSEFNSNSDPCQIKIFTTDGWLAKILKGGSK